MCWLFWPNGLASRQSKTMAILGTLGSQVLFGTPSPNVWDGSGGGLLRRKVLQYTNRPTELKAKAD